MPHTGKPSGACQQCKQRHIKCDEGRPACGRCTKANRICSGYAEGLDLVLRSQNDAAKAQVDRRQRAKNKSRPQSPDGQLTTRSPTPASVPHTLAESEESHALTFFVYTFALYSRDTQSDHGFIELLPYLFSNLTVGSPLSLTLTAVSYIIFGKWERKLKDVEFLALPHHGKALEATRVALQDPVQSMSDDTLMAVCLLGFYEALTASFIAKISSARHFEGAESLIKQRRNGETTEVTKRLKIAVRSNIVFRAMQFSSPIATSSGIWEDAEDLPQNPATLLDLVSVDVANLLATVKSSPPLMVDVTEVEDGRGDVLNDPSDLLARAIAVDLKLAAWPNTVPSTWFPIQVPAYGVPQSVTDAGIYGDSCDIYPDIMICSTWNEWRVARLKVLGLNARHGSNAISAEAIATIQQLVDGICASIPFSLGSRTEPGPLYEMKVTYPTLKGQPISKEHQKTSSAYGGWYLFAPFKETMNVGMYLREGQLEWLRGQLSRLAKMYDVKPA